MEETDLWDENKIPIILLSDHLHAVGGYSHRGRKGIISSTTTDQNYLKK